MFADVGDRRRLVVATVLTVIALPLLWTSKDSSSPGTQLAVTGASPSADLNAPAQSAAATPVRAFVAEPASSVASTNVITIDVAGQPAGSTATGKASYRNWPNGLTAEKRPCGTPMVPFGARIVVTNVDNGKKVACVNVTTRPLATGSDIVIDTATFVELADLTDAPLTVEMSW